MISISEETASSYIFGRKIRLVLHLRPPAADKAPGPLDRSTAPYIKLSGKNGLCSDFSRALRETLEARIWEAMHLSPTTSMSSSPTNTPLATGTGVGLGNSRIKIRTGIGGIERSIEAKHKETDENIALAFQDLKVLMAMAKDMVGISKVISNKIREQKGEISDDETVRFKSYLLSLGIDDPVTRESFTSNTAYFKSLSQQICEMLLDPIEVRLRKLNFHFVA